MKKARFVTPHSLLHSGAGALGRLGRQAAQLAEATRVLREHLAPPLNDHATVAAIRGPTLVVVVDSPVWVARLRYQSTEILEHLAGKLGSPPVSRLRVLVRPPPPQVGSSASGAPGRPKRPPPELIRSVSESLDPGPLRERLSRLAGPEKQGTDVGAGGASPENARAGEGD